MTARVVAVPLAEVADVVRGVTFRKSDVSGRPVPNLMPVLRAGNIGRDLELDRDLVWVRSELVSPGQMLRLNDLVMCASSGSAAVVGKSATVRRSDWHGTVGAFCFIVRSKSPLCSAEFLALVLRSAAFRNWSQRAAGTNIKNIRKSELEEFPIPLPPLDEQRRIVGILNRSAKIERLRAKAQERLREFIPALFIKMFGDPADNPMGWSVAELGDVSTAIGGGTPRRSNAAYFGGLIPWARPTDVTALSGLYIEMTQERITEMGLRESSARMVPVGTVLLTSRATIGYTAVAATSMATNPHVRGNEHPVSM